MVAVLGDVGRPVVLLLVGMCPGGVELDVDEFGTGDVVLGLEVVVAVVEVVVVERLPVGIGGFPVAFSLTRPPPP